MTFASNQKLRVGIRYLLLAAFTSLVLVRPAIAFAENSDQFESRMVTKIDRLDPYSGMLFLHGGYLWVGKSIDSQHDTHRVDLYAAPNFEYAATINLPHSIDQIRPIGANSVLATGKSNHGHWLTHYSQITAAPGSAPRVDTRTFPESFMIDSFAGNLSTLFFADRGEAQVYKLQDKKSGSFAALGPQISNPELIALYGETLWVLRSGEFKLGDENLVMLNTKTGKAKFAFDAHNRAGITHGVIHENSKSVLVNELYAQQIVQLDATSGEIKNIVAGPGKPTGIASFGKCAAVALVDKKAITFVKFIDANQSPSVIATWDLSNFGEYMKNARTITVSPEDKTVFVRSVYMCPTCDDTQSSVVMAKENGGGTVFEQCLAQ